MSTPVTGPYGPSHPSESGSKYAGKTDQDLRDMLDSDSTSAADKKDIAKELQWRMDHKPSQNNPNGNGVGSDEGGPDSIGSDSESDGLSPEDEDTYKKLLQKIADGQKLTTDEQAQLKDLQSKIKANDKNTNNV